MFVAKDVCLAPLALEALGFARTCLFLAHVVPTALALREGGKDGAGHAFVEGGVLPIFPVVVKKKGHEIQKGRAQHKVPLFHRRMGPRDALLHVYPSVLAPDHVVVIQYLGARHQLIGHEAVEALLGQTFATLVQVEQDTVKGLHRLSQAKD